MSQGVRDALAELIYAAIGVGVGLLVASTGDGWLASVGVVGALLAGLFGLIALFELANEIRSGESD